MIQIPPYLKAGDTIGMVCPAGQMPAADFQQAIQTLTDWGFRVKTGCTPGAAHHYFSAPDDVRRQDLQLMLDDDSVQAILCARGGYGTGRIIDSLDFQTFAARPKWVIGFSDITVLHCHLLARYGIASLHAPMAAAFNDGEFGNEYVRSLRMALTGIKADYLHSPHDFNRNGEASGVLVGGNLSLLVHLIGTPSDPDYTNKILFIEDVGEYIYNVDRMMYQLRRSGKLTGLAGLIVGKFTEMKDTTTSFGQTAEEVIRDVVADVDYPVCFDFPVSHDRENYALKVGVAYDLVVNGDVVELREI